MSAPRYARGVHSLAICDRCGDAVPYRELRRELLQFKNIQGNLQRTNIRVCRDCVDTDVKIRHVRIDAMALRNPRPDIQDPAISPPAQNGNVLDSAGLIWDQNVKQWSPPTT